MPITKEKKEVIATVVSRRVKEELRKADFYKEFFNKIKDREIEPGDELTFTHSIVLVCNTKTNEVTVK